VGRERKNEHGNPEGPSSATSTNLTWPQAWSTSQSRCCRPT